MNFTGHTQSRGVIGNGCFLKISMFFVHAIFFAVFYLVGRQSQTICSYLKCKKRRVSSRQKQKRGEARPTEKGFFKILPLEVSSFPLLHPTQRIILIVNLCNVEACMEMLFQMCYFHIFAIETIDDLGFKESFFIIEIRLYYLQ